MLVLGLEPRADGGLQAFGSGRAPKGVHLLERLEKCGELFDRFGGHAGAVGFSMRAERVGELKEAISYPLSAISQDGAPEGFEVALGELTAGFARDLGRMEPFGEGNPEPVFCARGVRVAQPPQRLKERHLKLVVEQEGARQTALFWNLWRDGAYQTAPGRARWDDLAVGARLDLTFRLECRVHPQYGERRQLILREFFVTRGAPAESYASAELSI